MSVGLNRASGFYYSNPNRFRNIMRSEKILRKIDDVYLIDSLGNILLSDVRDITDELVIPSDVEYDQVLEGKPVFIADSLENKTTAMIKHKNRGLLSGFIFYHPCTIPAPSLHHP